MKQGKRYQRMEETRAQVLRYAVVLFLEQGYQETTLDQIAQRVLCFVHIPIRNLFCTRW